MASQATQSIVEPVTTTAPIAQVIPYARAAARYALAFTQTILRLVRKSTYPTTYLWPAFIYAVEPLVVFLQAVYELTLKTPAQLVAWLVQVLYPVYVLVGVAVITGLIVGYLGRLLAYGVIVVVKEDVREGKKEE